LNVLPYTGYWYYGATSKKQTAAFYCSYGLREIVPLLLDIRRRIVSAIDAQLKAFGYSDENNSIRQQIVDAMITNLESYEWSN